MVGPEHYWQKDQVDLARWDSACGDEWIITEDIFNGVGFIELTFEHNPLQKHYCDACVSVYMDTEYGMSHGIQSPGWTPEDGEIYEGEDLSDEQ
jgi:hypothetical protein